MSTAQATIDAVELCARPLARRIYQAVVVGLAIFLLTLVAFKQDFRGYLAEIRLTGPVMDGLDLEEAADWVKKLDDAVAAVANRPAATPGRAQLRITYIAMQPQEAASHVEDLAERWLYQYLPARLQSYRQAALADLRSVATTARDREDQARQQLELLRQAQLTQLQAKNAPEIEASPAVTTPEAEGINISSRNTVIQKLADVRIALTALSGERTSEHPRVRTLLLEAAALEQQLGILPGQPLPASTTVLAPQFVTHSQSHDTTNQAVAEVAAKISAALTELGQAASDRQTAEFCLSERMQDLAHEITTVHWSKARSVSVSRLGGTPRFSTLAFAGILAAIGGAVTFRAGRNDLAERALRSTTELASSLELPVVANLAYLRGFKITMVRRILSPGRLQLAVRLADAVVALSVVACLLSIAIEPTLARQVLADPFGALSEVLGRFGV